ncbi:MAG: response regulator [Halobacteriovoraceae bacterium]|nr:response regulator [Halobacteriovoraceae bacterium]
MKDTKILIVEDEAIVAVDIEQGLRSLDYHICGIAASGKEAIALAEKEQPDLVLMDIRLQGNMTGIEAAKIIKERFKIPAIFLTAHSDDATLQSARLVEPFGYLLKPFGIRELKVAIEMALYKAEVERKLLESEQWNRTIIESIQSAFIAMNSQGKIVDWNPFAEKIFGWSKKEAMEKDYVDLIVPSRLKKLYRRGLSNYVKTQKSKILERVMEQYACRRDGKEFPVEITISPALYDEEIYFLAFVSDISKRKQYEIQRARFFELERINRDLEQFAHLVSHDLQAPLNTISMYTQLLENKFLDKMESDEKTMFDHVVRKAKKMSILLNELLNYSQVGNSQNLDLSKIDSNLPLQEALGNLENQMRSRKIEISYENLPPVMGNNPQLEQLFQNLLSNAMKFNDKELIKIDIAARRKGQFWEFSVKDNGVGFNQEYADQIFEMFRRLHTDTQFPGTGAGLAICQRIVSLHGGKIWAKSRIGKGSSFYFTLPASDSLPEKGALDGMRILLVDDDRDAKNLLTYLLNNTGVEVKYAENGLKALDYVKSLKFDLILMDLDMPFMNGVETVSQIKKEGIHVPVVAFTNFNIERTKEKTSEKTFVDFVSKSMLPKEIIEHLHVWYERAAENS